MTPKKLCEPSETLTVPLQIPTRWTASQAVAVIGVIDDLRDAIWRCYELKLLTEYISDKLEEAGTPSSEDPDDLPF